MDVVMATLKKSLTLARTMREQKKLESGNSVQVPGKVGLSKSTNNNKVGNNNNKPP